jgi:hypothetical protein
MRFAVFQTREDLENGGSGIWQADACRAGKEW